ncbi:unnamed protein product [Periconia digitata]|uniref:Uncharacterized protein n=1 Tax=Periconia digitata TaxID=1303443 RepID=A0A9W4XIC3_9PLEO|nr:unnamed protein product [Periconia digitata]
MHSFNFIVALFFALIGFSAAFPQFHFLEAREKGEKNGTSKAKNGTSGNSINKECKQMAKLTALTAFANNQTKIDALTAKGKLDDSKVAALKSQAAEASTKLQAMTANTTLVSECAVVFAHKKTVGQCKQMKSLAKLASLASNQTAMDAMIAAKKLNDTQAVMLQDKVKSAQTKLDDLKANTTLTDICSKEASQKGASDSASGTESTGTTNAGAAAASQSSSAMSANIESVSFALIPVLVATASLFL